jgi:pyrimidine deaminase RibD-like protein
MKRRVLEIITANTVAGSRHQIEALKMAEEHFKRFKCEIKLIKCNSCGKTLECVRWINRNGTTADTWGYMEFDAANECHRCLDEGYISDIYIPKEKQSLLC